LFTALLLGVWLAGVLGAIVGLVAVEAIAVGVNHWALGRRLPEWWSGWQLGDITWRELSAMGRFGALAIVGSLCTTLAIWFSNVALVNQLDGYSALGIFNAAERWRQVLLFLPASLAPIVLPMLSNLHGQNDAANYRKVVGLNLFVNIAVVLAPAIGVMMLAPLAMSLFGTQYQDGSLTLVVLAASAVASVLNTFLGQILVSKGAVGWRFAVDLLLGAMLLLVSWHLIPAYGDLGLAYGNLAAYGIAALGLVPAVLYYLNRSDSGPTDEAREGEAPAEPS
jgi:O-antigen/teichoic acid export membrane protein